LAFAHVELEVQKTSGEHKHIALVYGCGKQIPPTKNPPPRTRFRWPGGACGVGRDLLERSRDVPWRCLDCWDRETEPWMPEWPNFRLRFWCYREWLNHGRRSRLPWRLQGSYTPDRWHGRESYLHREKCYHDTTDS
jgi:hypothetical protein